MGMDNLTYRLNVAMIPFDIEQKLGESDVALHLIVTTPGGTKTLWVPRKLVEVYEAKVFIPAWLAKKTGLIGETTNA